MTEPFARRQPSNNLEELQAQLLRELSRSEEGRLEDPELVRAYIQHAQVLAWRGVADGDMSAPGKALECLRAAQPFIDRNMPDLEPMTTAAAEAYIVSQSLSLAAEALAKRRVEDRLSEARSEIERAILQVLADNRGTFLRRGEILDRLNEENRPTPPRVGQILAELHEENVVLRIHGRAQGNPNAAFYALSPRGVELCRNLGLIEEKERATPERGPQSQSEQEQVSVEADLTESETLPLLDQALSTLLAPDIPMPWQSILTGLLCNLEPNSEIRSRFSAWVRQAPDDPRTQQVIGTVLASWNYHDKQSSQYERLPKVVELEKYRAIRAALNRIRLGEPTQAVPAAGIA